MNTEECRIQLKKLRAGKSLLLSATDLTPQEKQIWYHASRRERMKVSIRTMPTGTYLWKVNGSAR